MNIVLTWVLIYIFIYIKEKDKNEATRCMPELHWFISEVSDFAKYKQNTIFEYCKANFSFFCTVHNVTATDTAHFKF